MKYKSYWTNTNLGEAAYRKIQAALAEDKAIQAAMPRYTDVGERCHQRNVKAINQIIADIDAIIKGA